jgi:pimeloyl-ACP methyl ester carboxylesterase
MRCRLFLLIAGVALPASTLLAQASYEDKFFTSDGVRIRYVDVGRGEPVVLVHGFSSSLDANYAQFGTIDKLAKDFRVIALDCRGHGKSDKPHDAAQYGMHMVTDVRNLLDHLSIRRAHIVGYSMGGAITGKFITTYPERVLTAIFGGSSPRMAWTEQGEKDAEELARSLENGKGIRPLILRLAPPNGPKPSEEEIEQLNKLRMATNDALALAAVTRGNREQVVNVHDVKALKMPILAMVGADDPLIAGVRAFKGVLPAVQLVVVEGATHSGARGLPARAEFAGGVRDFIAAHRTTTSQ